MSLQKFQNRLCFENYLIICFICWIPVCLCAQNIITDSVEIKKKNSISTVFYSDIRNSFVFGDIPQLFRKTIPVTVYGFAVGAEFKGLHQYTVGFYMLTKNAQQRLARSSVSNDIVNARWKLTYIGLGYTFTFLDKRKYELRLPLEIGLGQGLIITKDIFNAVSSTQKGIVVPLSFGFLADYKLTRWFGIQGLVGYRKTVIGRIFNNNFDSPYYSIGFSFNFENIKNDILKYYHSKKLKKEAFNKDFKTNS